ncbi:MerR family DNA-binding transcriptional regulator [Actinomadura rifamycini]|uniref:MerR family DNA-binding transcriptional regulator n=1 Tax=Actinomadura rifamycini TaxID=31962 RepID=UPI001B7FC880|nr:MerR family DNA-binding transcriptional regulator [Actinomadura rifamycini]
MKALRPVDLAREHGLSAQAVRNYEEDGILPPAERSASGYRRYTAVHAQALRAFLALRAGYGHATAAEILRAAGRGDDDALFGLIDRAHADLLHERGVLDQVAAALGDLTAAPPADDPRRELSIGELAHQLGMHPASLRKWEAAGILRPRRDPTGRRRYPPDVVRDAHAARQLRRGGYPLRRIELFVDRLRAAGGATALEDVLAEWRTRLRTRSRAMLAAATPLDEYLHLRASSPGR